VKIRSGFVSNSSSSSFVAVVPMETHEWVLRLNHPYVRAVVEALGGKKTVFGIECFVTSTYSDQGTSTWEWLDVKYPVDEIPDTEYGNEMDAYYAYEEIYLPGVQAQGKIFMHTSSH